MKTSRRCPSPAEQEQYNTVPHTYVLRSSHIILMQHSSRAAYSTPPARRPSTTRQERSCHTAVHASLGFRRQRNTRCTKPISRSQSRKLFCCSAVCLRTKKKFALFSFPWARAYHLNVTVGYKRTASQGRRRPQTRRVSGHARQRPGRLGVGRSVQYRLDFSRVES